MDSLQNELLNSAWKHNKMVFHTWPLTCSPTISPYLIIKTRRPVTARFKSPWRAQLSFQFRWLQFFLSPSSASSTFLLPHIQQMVHNIMRSHRSCGSSVVQADELPHPSVKQWTLVPSGPILSSELTAKEQILCLGLVEINMPKCLGHRVLRNATRNIQDEPNMGKQLLSPRTGSFLNKVCRQTVLSVLQCVLQK